MKTKETTIAGKQVTIAYCYATEIIYKNYTGEDIGLFVGEVGAIEKTQKLPEVKKTLYFILSSILSYYQSKEEKSPIQDTDLMYGCDPKELWRVVGEIIVIRHDWYDFPKDEPEENVGEDAPKNA